MSEAPDNASAEDRFLPVPVRLPSKQGLQPTSSPRTTESNRRRLSVLFASFTSSPSSPAIIRRLRSSSIVQECSDPAAPPSVPAKGDVHDAADATLGMGNLNMGTPSRGRLWNWLSPTKKAVPTSDAESEEWDEGCFVDALTSQEEGSSGILDLGPDPQSPISRLPDELLLLILLHLPPTASQLHTLSLVSKHWSALSYSPLLWSRAILAVPQFRLNPDALAKGVAASHPPNGQWEGLTWVWDLLPEARVVQESSPGAESRGWFGRRWSGSFGVSTTASPSRSPVQIASIIPPSRPSTSSRPPSSPSTSTGTFPLHYPTLYRSRLAVAYQIRNPSSSHPTHSSTLTKHTDSVYCLQFRGEWLITGSRDKTIRIWRLSPVDLQGNVGKTRLMRTVLEAHAGSVLSLDFEIAAAGDDAEEVEGRKPKDKAQKGMIVTGSSDMTAGIWDVDFPTSDESKSKKPRVERIGILRGHIGGVLDVCLGKRHIVTCSKDASIRVFDRASLQHLRTIGGHDGPVNCLSLNPDREIGQVVSASGDGSWVIWDLGTGEQILRGGGDGRGLACVVWEDDYIITGDNDRLVKLFSARTSDLIRVFEGHTDLVRTVSVNVPDGLLVSGSYDRTIRMWDLHTGELVRKLKSTHTSLVFDVQLSTTRLVSYVPSFGTANGKGIGLIGRTSHDNSVQVLTFGTGLPYLGLFA